jgi:hypothetical protein
MDWISHANFLKMPSRFLEKNTSFTLGIGLANSTDSDRR